VASTITITENITDKANTEEPNPSTMPIAIVSPATVAE